MYSDSVDGQKCAGSYVVLKLLETLPKNEYFHVSFDNWFSSIPLLLVLKQNGYLASSTQRVDRTKKCSLLTEKDLRKKVRGSHCHHTDANTSISVTKWYNKKCVQLISNFCNHEEVRKVKRWDRKEKKFTDINCPSAAMIYNKSMRGVDLSDMLISLYQTKIKTKRWYHKVLFHCADIAKVNAWLLYRKYCNQLYVPKKKQLNLLKFTISVASAVINAGTIQRSTVGRPWKRKSDTDDIPQSVIKKSVIQEPVEDVRYDNIAYWPEYRESKNKCRYCKTENGRVYCMKCNLCLCLSNAGNCFFTYHTK